jgi:hypothetical protein
MCPTGVTSPDPLRQRALVVPDKAERVLNFHHNTIHALSELVAAAGLEHPDQLGPHHFLRRGSADRVVSYAEQYDRLQPGELLVAPETAPHRYADAWRARQAGSFVMAAHDGGVVTTRPRAAE